MEEIIETATPSETVETPITEQAVTTENAEPSNEAVETKPEKTFTQAELNDIVTKRVERERESTAKRVAQEARDAAIAELGMTWNGKPITSEAEYKRAKEEETILKQYEDKDLSDAEIQQILEDRRFRMQNEPKLTELEKQEQAQADYQAFLAVYPDVQGDDIPASVWAEVNAGKSLVDAYARYENQLLKQRLAEVEKKQQIEQQNQESAASSTGSVTGQGDNKETHFTREQVAQMSQADVDKNYLAIVASMKKW